MTDFNKGDFTQQGVDGHVNAKLRLNAKRYLDIDLTSNEQASGCTISGHVYDSLNDITYPIGSAPSGNIEITENGSNINVAPYATATVNIAGGSNPPVCTVKLFDSEAEEEINFDHAILATTWMAGDIIIPVGGDVSMISLYVEMSGSYYPTYKYFNSSSPFSDSESTVFTDLVNISIIQMGTKYVPVIIDETKPSSMTYNTKNTPK